MKRNSNSRLFNPEQYDGLNMDDTRFYGVYLKGHGEDAYVLVDPKRYQKQFHVPEKMAEAMKGQKWSIFRPARNHRVDYNVNFMLDELSKIRNEWENTYKPMKDLILSKIVAIDYNNSPYDDELAMSGILDPTEVSINAYMKTIWSTEIAERKRDEITSTLYSQYFHQIASQIEALFIRTLIRSRKDYTGEKFNRNDIYFFQGNKQESAIRNLEGYKDFDKLYRIWAFLKHNNLSSYVRVKEIVPDILQAAYTSGELAMYYINFDDTLIESIFDGLKLFFKNYCALVYNEDAEIADWNSSEYFREHVRESMEESANPLGLPPWI
jgi:hypothetical protein